MSRQTQEKERQEKMDRILELNSKGLNQAQIGRVLGLSRERIRQIILMMPREHRDLFVVRKKAPIEDRICLVCGEVFRVRMAVRKKTCSRLCGAFIRTKYHTEEERIQARRDREKRRYEKDKTAYHKYQWQWRKSHPNSKAAINQREYFKKWYQKNKEKIMLRCKERYQTDPEFRRKAQERCRASYRKRMASKSKKI